MKKLALASSLFFGLITIAMIVDKADTSIIIIESIVASALLWIGLFD